MAATRSASAVWEGDLMKGQGKVTAGTGIFRDQPVTWAARTGDPAGHTSPEELLASAHAACFSMALAHTLAGAGTPPRRLETTARVVFDKADAGFAVKSSTLTVRGYGRGFDAAAFAKAAEAAKDGCPISKALKGNVALSVNAEFGGE
jgi:osmotically inducible protein OsmC